MSPKIQPRAEGGLCSRVRSIRFTRSPVSSSARLFVTGVGGGSLMTPILIVLFGGQQTCCRCFCPADSEHRGGTCHANFQIELRSGRRRTARYRCKIANVPRLEFPANLLTLPN